MMLPLMRLTGDGQEHTTAEAVDFVADQFSLTPVDREELLPSGTQAKVNNRVAWARFHLIKAGLLQSTGRGRFKITAPGLQIVAENPAEINLKLLDQIPEFAAFRASIRQNRSSIATSESSVAIGDFGEIRQSRDAVGRTPDFRVISNDRLAFYCEVKMAQQDEWL